MSVAKQFVEKFKTIYKKYVIPKNVARFSSLSMAWNNSGSLVQKIRLALASTIHRLLYLALTSAHRSSLHSSGSLPLMIYVDYILTIFCIVMCFNLWSQIYYYYYYYYYY